MSAKTIQVDTTRFGQLDVPEDSIINVVGGVIGFPGMPRFVMLDYNPPFSWLQCIDNAALAFVVVNAAEFGEEYVVPLPFGDRELELKQDDEVAIVNLVTVRPNPAETTVNLKAPVVVNLRNMTGRQIVLDDPRYPTRLPLWASEEGGAAASSNPAGSGEGGGKSKERR